MSRIFKAMAILFGLCFVLFGQVQASQTNVILNLEGNPTCKSLGDNQSVLQVDVKGESGTVALPTTLGGTQFIDYVVGDVGGTEGLVSWEITGITAANQDVINPINYIILKNQGGKTGARVFHFGTTDEDKGAVSDTNEAGVGTNLASISFCYGLTTGISTPSQSENIADLPSCDSLNDTNSDGTSDLFSTGIICPTIGPDGGPPEEQVIVNMALNKPNMGFEGSSTVRACTCNVTLPACNPELPAVDISQQANGDTSETRSCLEFGGVLHHGTPTGVNERVPFAIEVVENPDSYICYVIGGRRYCYGHY